MYTSSAATQLLQGLRLDGDPEIREQASEILEAEERPERR
jgi:hypothetical protein